MRLVDGQQYYKYNAPVSLAKIKICLVDDHPIMLQGLSMILADSPTIDVVSTFCGGQAALMGLSMASAFEVAVIDIRMPDIDGFEVMESVRYLFPDTKILAHTALCDGDTVRKALSCGAHGFVQKSSGPGVLAAAITRVHEDGVFFCPESQRTISADFSTVLKRRLTNREQKILFLLKSGESNQAIARELFISYSTARFHIKNIYRKLGINNRSQLPD